MLCQNRRLFFQTGRRQGGKPQRQGVKRREDPRIANRAASNADAVDAGFENPVKARLGGKQIPTAQDYQRRELGFNSFEKRPVRLAGIAL